MRSVRPVRADATPRWPHCSPPESFPASKVLSFGAFIAAIFLHPPSPGLDFIPTGSFIARPGRMPKSSPPWKKAHPGIAGVVGELNCLPLTPSRRLQLAAETSKVTALVVRRSSASEQEPNAATSRWRVSSMPSGDQGIGMGRGRWQVELLRCRGAEPNSWVVEACDAQGRLALPADVAVRPRAEEERRRATA